MQPYLSPDKLDRYPSASELRPSPGGLDRRSQPGLERARQV